MKKIVLFILILSSCKSIDERPNILFIMSDDHTSQSWGIYGGILQDYVKNEGIKRLEKSGVVLENLFCTNAICVPSRASILTGQYSHLNGVYNLPDSLEPDSLNVAKILNHLQLGGSFSVFDQQSFGISEGGHFADFARGIISLGDITYYFSITIIFLMLTILILERRRWR